MSSIILRINTASSNMQLASSKSPQQRRWKLDRLSSHDQLVNSNSRVPSRKKNVYWWEYG